MVFFYLNTECIRLPFMWYWSLLFHGILTIILILKNGNLIAGCGIAASNSEVFVESAKVQIGESPWNVAIYEKKKTQKIFKCSGTIISSTVVVSGKEKKNYILFKK